MVVSTLTATSSPGTGSRTSTSTSTSTSSRLKTRPVAGPDEPRSRSDRALTAASGDEEKVLLPLSGVASRR